MKKHVMIVTGEASGDLHGANLVRAMQKSDPDIVFSGMGGQELDAAGVRILFDAARVSVVGVAEVVSQLGDIIQGQRILKQNLAEIRPDLLIIIDLPDFNLLLARKAKKLGIPVFYYICPQVWAWRSSRVKTIAERTDQVGVILPFEEDFLRQRGVSATYVGHPLLDSVEILRTRDEFLDFNNIDKTSKCIGLLPGSRKKEISALLPDFLEAAGRLQQMSGEELTFLIPVASTITDLEVIKSCIREYGSTINTHIIEGDRYSLMASCESAVAASGTVTLELALLDTPMVVTYRVSPLTYRIGRMLIKLDHFSLVNLIGEKEVVPELLQDQVTPESIAENLYSLTFDEAKRAEMKDGLKEVRARLGEKGASRKAAALALKMIT